MKWIGLLLVVAAGGLMGVYASILLKQRVKVLTLTEELLSFLKTRMMYTAQPLGTMLREAVSQPRFAILTYLRSTVGKLDTYPFPVAWQKSIEENGLRDGLSREDTALLIRIGAELGRTDVQGQITHLEMTHRQVGEQREEAQKIWTVKGKLYRTLGFSAGAVLALLLL